MLLSRKIKYFSALSLSLLMGGLFLFSEGLAAAPERNQDLDVEITKPVYQEGEVLVRFKKEEVNLNNRRDWKKINRLEGVKRDKAQDIRENNIALLKGTKDQTTEELVKELANNPKVESVQPNFLYYPTSQTEPWGVSNDYGVKSRTANTNGYTGDGVVVAVIDTGVYYAHTDLDGNLWSPSGDNCYIDGTYTAGGCPNHGYDFSSDDNDPTDARAASHGTHVAGTIAAEDNSSDVVGVAPEAEIMVIKAIYPDVSGAATTNSLVRSMNFAKDNGADIVNMSLGHYHANSLRASGDTTAFDDYFRESIEQATAAGVLTVAASGNDALQIYGYPAGFADVLTVGAIQQYDSGNNPQEDLQTRLAYFSNYGRNDLVAPGVNINSTTGDGSTSGDTWAGTSMATPHVAGVAALVKEKYPSATPAQLKQILQTTTTDLGATGRDIYFGSGLVNAEAATGTLTPTLLLETNWVEDNDTDEPTYYLPSLPADGISTTKIRIIASDSQGQPLSGVTVYFSTDLGTLSAGSAVTDASGQATVTFTASDLAGTATIRTVADGYSEQTSEIKMANILLVSSAGEPYRHATSNYISWYYTRALEELGYNFVRYETYHRDPDDWSAWSDVVDQTPSLEYMQKFDLVIWYGGDWPFYNQDILESYLSAGGNLIVTGQDFGYHINQGNTSDTMYSSRLKASFVSDGTTTDTIVYGADILDGLTLTLVDRYASYGFAVSVYGTGNLYPDHISADSTATVIGGYTSGGADAGLRYYNGSSRIIYLPWAFDSLYYQSDRVAVMQRMVESIMPLQTVTAVGVAETSQNDVNKINVNTESDVTVEVTLEEAPSQGVVYVELSDGSQTASGYAVVDTTSTTQTVSGIDVSSLATGKVAVAAVHAYSIDQVGTLTTGTEAYKNSVINKPTNLTTPKKYRKVRTVKLKWDAVAGADYYKVQLKSKKGKAIKTFKSVSHNYKNVKKKYTKSNYPMKFRVKACVDGQGCGSYSNYDHFRTKPAKVKNLQLINVTFNSLQLNWDEVRGKNITYQVRLLNDKKEKIKVYKTTKDNLTIDNLTSGKTYKIRVRAKYSKNNIGKYTDIQTFTTLW